MDAADVEARAARFKERHDAIEAALRERVVGHDDALRALVTCVLAGGHALIEGVPGLGKTLLVRTLAEALALSFSRIQCTPDLMPADILGTDILYEEPGGRRGFRFERGPIFGQLVLVDEVNRAAPKTQSALLEAMQEGRVTARGVSHALEPPFCVLATQNPIELEGTYPLPEAQLDRFLFKVLVRPPSREGLVEVLARTTGEEPPPLEPVVDAQGLLEARAFVRLVPCAQAVLDYAARLVLATHPDAAAAPEEVRRYVRYGASPRGAQALVLAAKVRALSLGRLQVSYEDIRAQVPEALRHRLIPTLEAEAEGVAMDDVLAQVARAVAETG